MIDPVTFAKFQFASGNASEVLLKYIDADVLPGSLGGKHAEYPVPSRPVGDEIAEFLKSIGSPPSASDVSAVTGCTEKTTISGGLSATYSGEVTVLIGATYSLEV